LKKKSEKAKNDLQTGTHLNTNMKQ